MASTDLFTQTQVIRKRAIRLSSGTILHVTKNPVDNLLTWSDTDKERALLVSVELDSAHNFVVCGTVIKNEPVTDDEVEDICRSLLRPGTDVVVVYGIAYSAAAEVFEHTASFMEVVSGDKSLLN